MYSLRFQAQCEHITICEKLRWEPNRWYCISSEYQIPQIRFFSIIVFERKQT